MKRKFISIIAGAAVLTGAAAAYAGVTTPVYDGASQLKSDRAVMYFDSSNRMNLKILLSFMDVCSERPEVQCIYAESSALKDAAVKDNLNGLSQSGSFYRGTTDKTMPRMEIYKGDALVGAIESDGNLTDKPAIYVDYLAGMLNDASLAQKLKATDSADLYKKMVPRMNFVLMLAKKGEKDTALKELSSIDASQLDDKGKLIFAQTYLRLKSPDKAIEILSGCEDMECKFYLGVAQYVAGDTKKGIATLRGLRGKYKNTNRLNYYLKEMYIADGDKKHADEIKLPADYNVNSD